jgi:hypothetical protein
MGPGERSKALKQELPPMGRGERGCAEARAAADGAGREGHSAVTAAARARKQGAAAAAAGCGELPFFFCGCRVRSNDCQYAFQNGT